MYFASRCACLVLLALSVILTGCGGGGGPVTAEEQPVAGNIYPAEADIVLEEHDVNGITVQKASPSGPDGSFVFARSLTGPRIQAVVGGSDRQAPLMRSARIRNASASARVTALTTLFDKFALSDLSLGEANTAATALLTESCGADAASAAAGVFFADAPSIDRRFEWLLQAVGAYLESFKHIGVSAQMTGIRWNERLLRRKEVLARMCSVARGVWSDAWHTSAKVAIAERLSLDAGDPVLATIAQLRPPATKDVLDVIGYSIVALEYPTLTLRNEAARQALVGHEPDLVLQLVELRLQQRLTSGAPDGTARTGMTIELDESGAIVQSISGSLGHTDTNTIAPLRFINGAATDRQVGLVIDDTGFRDLDEVLTRVLAMPALTADEPLWQRAWRFVVSYRQHRSPISGGRFLHQPDLYLRSMGAGFCDDVASVLHWIWKGLGFDARVVGLGGHVVAEVNTGARWELYDADFGYYFFNRTGTVASVEDVANDPDLILNPYMPPVAAHNSSEYPAQVLADIYASKENNGAEAWYSLAHDAPLSGPLTIPSGGYLEIGGGVATVATIDVPYSVDLTPIRVWYPPGYVGPVSLPMILVNVEGDGRVSAMGSSFDLSTGGIASSIVAYYQTSPNVGIDRIELDHVGASGITITMVANPLLWGDAASARIEVKAEDLSGITTSEPSRSVAERAAN